MSEEIFILKTYPNHSIFDMDLRKQYISKLNDIEPIGNGLVKYTPQDDHWYESALNEGNAFKKFNRKARYIVTGKK